MIRPIVMWLVRHWYVVAMFWAILLTIGLLAWKRFNDILKCEPHPAGTEDYEAWLRGDTREDTRFERVSTPAPIMYLFKYEYKKNGVMQDVMEERACLSAQAANDWFFARGKELGVTTDNLRRATYHRKDQAPSETGCYRGNA